jgi:putative transposase
LKSIKFTKYDNSIIIPADNNPGISGDSRIVAIEASRCQKDSTMPKRTIRFAPNTYYHIYNRGAGRQSIVREERNYLYLLRLMKQVASECNISFIAYGLLPNHYHWLVRQNGDTSAQQLPARVFGSYTRAFNNAYQRSGTLFEGPYEVILVNTDEYLHNLCRYIHANPVLHGIATAPELWPYSNYLEWIGARQGTLVDRIFIQTHFPDSQQYQRFVRDYLTTQTTLPEGLRRYLAELEE